MSTIAEQCELKRRENQPFEFKVGTF
jgi:hypothetical protein